MINDLRFMILKLESIIEMAETLEQTEPYLTGVLVNSRASLHVLLTIEEERSRMILSPRDVLTGANVVGIHPSQAHHLLSYLQELGK